MRRLRGAKLFSTILLVAGLVLAGGWGWTVLRASREVRPPPAADSSPASAAPASRPEPSAAPEPKPGAAPQPIVYPTGKMFVSTERLAYRDGDMVLRVPRLELEAPVLGGFDDATRDKLTNGAMTAGEQADFFGNSQGDALLKLGLVLLNSASPPGEGIANSNVSISGHRDVDGCEFYFIDTLAEGDRMILEYGGREYVYEYLSTSIHQANDWSVTYCGEFPLLTLISCDPIGTSLNRIVVTAGLVETNELA